MTIQTLFGFWGLCGLFPLDSSQAIVFFVSPSLVLLIPHRLLPRQVSPFSLLSLDFGLELTSAKLNSTPDSVIRYCSLLLFLLCLWILVFLFSRSSTVPLPELHTNVSRCSLLRDLKALKRAEGIKMCTLVTL